MRCEDTTFVESTWTCSRQVRFRLISRCYRALWAAFIQDSPLNLILQLLPIWSFSLATLALHHVAYVDFAFLYLANVVIDKLYIVDVFQLANGMLRALIRSLYSWGSVLTWRTYRAHARPLPHIVYFLAKAVTRAHYIADWAINERVILWTIWDAFYISLMASIRCIVLSYHHLGVFWLARGIPLLAIVCLPRLVWRCHSIWFQDLLTTFDLDVDRVLGGCLRR